MRVVLFLLALFLTLPLAAADTTPTFRVVLKEHRFIPAKIMVPANRVVILRIKNLDAEPEEFNSSDLKVQKVVTGNSEGIIRLHPLAPGRYTYQGEYHKQTAQGIIFAQ